VNYAFNNIIKIYNISKILNNINKEENNYKLKKKKELNKILNID
jgi:hypothetical protein